MTRTRCTAVAAFLAGLAFAAATAHAEEKLPDAARTALEKADAIDVLSLDPQGDDESKDAFHDYKVLARATVTDDDARKAVVAAVLKGVAESDGAVAKCFEPRHGLHVVYKGKTYDFLICYQCSQIQVFAEAAEEPETVGTTAASRAALDKALRESGAPGK
jgi:hypothetical protein